MGDAVKAAAVLALVVTGCLNRPIIDCNIDADCVHPHVCVDDRCIDPDDLENASSSSTSPSSSSSSSSGSHASSSSSGGQSSSFHQSACPVPSLTLDTGVTEDLNGVWAEGDCSVWAVGNGNTVLHWNGTSVEHVPGPISDVTNDDLDSIWASGSQVFILSNDEQIGGEGLRTYFSTDAGAHWTASASNVICDPQHARMHRSYDDAIWLQCPDNNGQSGHVHRWSTTSSTWIDQGRGFSVWVDPDHIWMGTTAGVTVDGTPIPDTPPKTQTVAFLNGTLRAWQVDAFRAWRLVDGNWMEDAASEAVFDLHRHADGRLVGTNGVGQEFIELWDGTGFRRIDSNLSYIEDVDVTESYIWLVHQDGLMKVMRL